MRLKKKIDVATIAAEMRNLLTIKVNDAHQQLVGYSANLQVKSVQARGA
jgi:hypothetical protein